MSYGPNYGEYTNEQLLENMESLAKGGNREVSHRNADSILKEALRRTASGDQDMSQWVDDLLDAYNSVGKWYA